jgi:aryl-alcohol dehydrogenase-like predicted oxidoreductase
MNTTAPLRFSRRRFLQMALAICAGGLWPKRGLGAQTDRLLHRRIPASGELLPAVGLGTYRVFDVHDDAAAGARLETVLRRFVALGGSVIDSSPMYGSAEAVVGDLSAALGLRERLFLATKVWTTGRAAGIRQMEDSLRRMRTPVMDLMQIHNLVDWRTQLETLRAWKRQGRIRYIGITHYVPGAFDELEAIMKGERIDFVQLPYSIATRDAERSLLPLAQQRGIAVLVNRPYEQGALFHRVRGRPLPPWANDYGIASWGQYFLKFILAHPAVTCVIPATGKPRHLEDNMGAGFGRLPDAAARERMADYFMRG